MQPPMKQGNSNDFQTPPEALEPLMQFLKKDWTIWECACGKGNLVNELERLEFKVFGSDLITETPNQLDFLTQEPPSEYDCIITNPPFSLKKEFLERVYQLKKPFAFLLPLTTFETASRQDLFKKFGVEVIMFDKRINFETPNGKGSGSWFATMWVTWKLNLPNQINFVKLSRGNENLKLL